MTDFVLLGQAGVGSNSAIITFVAYIGVVMFLAWLSSRVAKRDSFLSDYFLGGRNLGVWAFALTFAATSASGGSFIGFPSLVYTHGWSVALWIASYMLVPLVALGLLAKRLNQIARKTDAITVADLIRDRFQSPILGLVATLIIVFFMSFNLVAQFKGGSIILQTLLSDVPLFQTASQQFAQLVGLVPLGLDGIDPSYLLCLCVFALAVVVYTTYGGFRAVVWTDVLQGFVMVLGILILLPMTLIAVGGLSRSTESLAKRVPPIEVKVKLSVAGPIRATTHQDNKFSTPVARSARLRKIPKDSLLTATMGDKQLVLRLAESAVIDDSGEVLRNVSGDKRREPLAALQLSVPQEEIRYEPILQPFIVDELTAPDYSYGANKAGVYTSLPGPSASAPDGFLPLAAGISFFFYWCFASAGQPSNMVRCMAFRDSKTLIKAIFTVSVYYSLIYFPIVIIFCCAQTLLPGWETSSDRIMPEMASTVTMIMGVPWLAGILVAAPFAAVMSTMDSFLLMISSSVVRDIYQRWINPEPTQRRIKVLTYTTTFVVGIGAMIAAINPPQFLQAIIVFTGSGLATCFLAPVTLALYWPRFNHQGAIAGMLVGFVSNVALYAIGSWQIGRMSAYQPLGLHPIIIGTLAALVTAIVVCLASAPPKEELVLKFFYRRKL